MTSRIGQAPHNIIGMFVTYCDTVSRHVALRINKAFNKAFNDPDKLRAALSARGFPTSETTSKALKKQLCLTEVRPTNISFNITFLTRKDDTLGVVSIPRSIFDRELSTIDFIQVVEKTIADLKSNTEAYEKSHPEASARFEQILKKRFNPAGKFSTQIPHSSLQKKDPEFAQYVSDAARLRCLLDGRRDYQIFRSFINRSSIQQLISTQLQIKAPKPKVEADKDAMIEPPKRVLQPKRIVDAFRIDPPRRRVPVQRTPRIEPPKAETTVRFFSMPKTVWGKLGLAGVFFNTIPVFASGILQLNIAKIFSTAILTSAAVYAFNRLENPSGASFIRTFAMDAFHMMTCRCERPNRS
ncbi:MAG TPA: hypothetical protein VLG44_04355 [Chlamydiales bacterium]|nr:hypothetical protein [Chlamydiales bacterium]